VISKPLSAVAEVIRGVSFSKDDGDTSPSEGRLPVIRAGSIQDSLLLNEGRIWVHQEKVNENQKIRRDDIIMCTSSGSSDLVGKCAKSEIDFNGSFGAFCAGIRPNKEKVSASYLYHFLTSPKFRNWSSSSSGANIKNIRISELAEFEIPLPPLEEQKRIAAILDKADAIRRKRQEALKLADEFLRAVFLDMFGDPVENTKGWEVKKLKDLSTKILSGNTPSGGSAVYVEKGITFFRSQNVWKNNLVFEDIAYIDEKTHKSMSKSSLKNRDILITKTGRINTENSSLGRAALYEGADDSANINGHVYLIRLADKSLCEFILFILTTKEYREYIRSVCVGGIDKRQLNKEHLEQFPIILPPAELQTQFINILKIVNLKREKALHGLKDSTELFDSLIQKAFSGKLN
jgi:type I restriction enzyme S subunit